MMGLPTYFAASMTCSLGSGDQTLNVDDQCDTLLLEQYPECSDVRGLGKGDADTNPGCETGQDVFVGEVRA